MLVLLLPCFAIRAGKDEDKTLLISDFRRVLKLVCFLLGISPASD
jgi:hypothetical protein